MYIYIYINLRKITYRTNYQTYATS